MTRFATLAGMAILLLCDRPTHAFNALGHQVVADIAWQELDEPSRREIVRTLRRHPRFDEDVAKRMPETDSDRWVFQQAAVWPDLIRGNRDFDMPTWHYVDFPVFVGPERPVTFNRSMTRKAAAHNGTSDATPRDKAVAYCWLFHLIGDLHQPMHSTALVCDRLPKGDKGGNDIPLVQSRNLPALWDGILGSSDRMADVQRQVSQLKQDHEAWKVDTTADVSASIAESHDLAKSFAYDPIILRAVEKSGELLPIDLPESYLKQAGAHAPKARHSRWSTARRPRPRELS